LKLPIKFIGVGENEKDMLYFSPRDFASPSFMKNLKDIFYLQMAYALAEKAKGWASPNPYVGTVIVRKDVIVGHGYHVKPGQPHAEAVALQRAGSLARNSTAYITLEPVFTGEKHLLVRKQYFSLA